MSLCYRNSIRTRRVSAHRRCLTAACFLVIGCKSATRRLSRRRALRPCLCRSRRSRSRPCPTSDTYVATIKSRRSATMQPQVDGNLTKIFVKSGDIVKAGQVLMQIDPLKQVATVQSQQGTQAQKKAVYDYNQDRSRAPAQAL